MFFVTRLHIYSINKTNKCYLISVLGLNCNDFEFDIPTMSVELETANAQSVIDHATPGCSRDVFVEEQQSLTHKENDVPIQKRKATKGKVKQKTFIALKNLEKVIQSEGEKNRELFLKMIEKQEQIIVQSTSKFMEGLIEILSPNTE